MKKNTICWDSSVMISYIGGDIADGNIEPSDLKQMQATQSVEALIEDGSYVLVASTILYVEVLRSRMPEHAIKCFNNLMLRKNLIKNVPVGVKIAKKAQELRDRLSLKTVDAIHVATAIVSEAPLFHTFDGKLLKLDGKDEVDGLRITPCEIPGRAGTLALPEN